MKKYFAYDALEREFTTHDTLQEAKSQAQDCVDEIFDIGADDGFGDDLEDGIKETCFGVALGGFDLPTRPLTKEEEDIYGDQYTYMVENPVLVEYPQNNGWIKCSERLPKPFDTSEELRQSSNRHLIYYTEDNVYWFVGFGWYLLDEKVDEEGGLIPYWELDELGMINIEIEVSHWQPLPQPPEE